MIDALEHRSGLAGVAGTPDMPEIIVRGAAGDGEAGLALGVYHHRLRSSMAAMVGQPGWARHPGVHGRGGRERAGGAGRSRRRAAALGVAYDPGANARAVPDADITGAGSHARVLVVAARERSR